MNAINYNPASKKFDALAAGAKNLVEEIRRQQAEIAAMLEEIDELLYDEEEEHYSDRIENAYQEVKRIRDEAIAKYPLL